MIDVTRGLFSKDDYILVYKNNGHRCAVNEQLDPEAWRELKAYLLAHPDALQPEPLPPPPSDAELEAAAEAQRQARFAEYDKAVSKCRRHIDEGDTSRDWAADLSAWHAYAMELEALNDAPGWFRDTVWPVKPEV